MHFCPRVFAINLKKYVRKDLDACFSNPPEFSISDNHELESIILHISVSLIFLSIIN